MKEPSSMPTWIAWPKFIDQTSSVKLNVVNGSLSYVIWKWQEVSLKSFHKVEVFNTLLGKPMKKRLEPDTLFYTVKGYDLMVPGILCLEEVVIGNYFNNKSLPTYGTL